MKMNMTFRKMKDSDAIERRVEKKFGKFSKFFGDGVTANVLLTKEKEDFITEVTIYHGGMIYRGEASNRDMYSSIDRVSEIIERQIRKNKTRLEKRLHQSAFVPDVDNDSLFHVEEEEEFNIVKHKKFPIKPMDSIEAILQMNLLGHEFFVYNDSQTNSPSVVYKRKDGDYGLIEVE